MWYGIYPQADVNILYIIVYYIVEMGMHIPIKFDLQYFLLRSTLLVFAFTMN